MRKSQVNKKIASTFYSLGVFTLVVSLVWVGVEIYNAMKKDPEVEVSKKNLEPISVNLDIKFLQEIAKRESLGKEVDKYLRKNLKEKEKTSSPSGSQDNE